MSQERHGYSVRLRTNATRRAADCLSSSQAMPQEDGRGESAAATFNLIARHGGTPVLVLSRKRDERIRIGTPLGDVWIEVVDIDWNKVRLGFVGPPNVEIDREEVYESKRKDRTS